MHGSLSPIASGPWKEGVLQGSDVVAGAAVEQRKSQEIAATELQSYAQDYVLFTLGLLDPLRQALPDADVLSRYAQEQGLELRVLNLRSQRPLFSGFKRYGLRELNYCLQGLPRDSCGKFSEWLPTVSFLDRRQQQLYRLQTQPLRLQGADVLGVWLDSTIGCAYFDDDGEHAARPRVSLSGYVFPQTRKLLCALLAENSHPFDQVYDNSKYRPA